MLKRKPFILISESFPIFRKVQGPLGHTKTKKMRPK